MTNVYVIADNIVSPLGPTATANFAVVTEGRSGIRLHNNAWMSPAPFYAAMLAPEQLQQYSAAGLEGYTKFEQLLILSVGDALSQARIDITSPRTAFIVSTTKGNIELLEQQRDNPPLMEQMELTVTARKVANHFHYPGTPLVISNACISGLLAIITAQRLIASGQYDHAVVTGADVVTQFVLSGFQSFQAVSPEPCRPFDADRKGVTLGEGAGTLILSKREDLVPFGAVVVVKAGSVSNDANHISGPSRTGAELGTAMRLAMLNSGLTPEDIGFVSAHGTATLYNDEMEAKALHLAGLQDTPVNSLKGYYGHTLGAAGLIEAIIGIHALQQQLAIPTLGFEQLGVSMPVNVIKVLEPRTMRHYLKTVSGFGGCNAAAVFSLI